jgi:hypothetical protein
VARVFPLLACCWAETCLHAAAAGASLPLTLTFSLADDTACGIHGLVAFLYTCCPAPSPLLDTPCRSLHTPYLTPFILTHCIVTTCLFD